MSQTSGRKRLSGQFAPYPPAAPSTAAATAANQAEAQIRSALSASPQFQSHPKQQSQYSATSFRREDARRQQYGAAAAATSSRVLFCPSQPDVYACINCVFSDSDGTTIRSTKQQQQQQQKEVGTSKRLGPVLLELRRLQLHDQNDNENHSQQLFRSVSLATSQGNPSLGTSVASTCMAYPDPEEDPSIVQEYTPCATGLSTGALCIHSFSTESDNDDVTANVTYYATRHQRQASAVAWRPRNTSQVAIGLVSSGAGSGSGGGGPISHHRQRSTRAGGGGSGDREFNCLLWDVTKGTTTAPISKLSHNVGVASLAWLSQGKTLWVGSQNRHFHVYDLRISGTTASPISTWAHTEAVNGIEEDASRDIVATFGRTAGEPVKLWDIRRMDTSVGEIKTAGGIVSAIQWSRMYPGTLSVALGDSVQHYDTTASLSRPVLARLSRAESTVLDLALYPRSHEERRTALKSKDEASDDKPNHEVVSELYQSRMLVVLADRSVKDMPKDTKAPLAISRRDGRLAHAFGDELWLESLSDGPLAMENPVVQVDEDISARMMRRAKCSRAARYSVDAALNLQMLSEEQDVLGDDESSQDMLPSIRMLIRLWSWIERVERFCNNQRVVYGAEKWPGKGLADSGVWRLLQLDRPSSDEGGANKDTVKLDEVLSLSVYDSPTRSLALSACGWAGSEALVDIQAECEACGDFERSAALAVWHGDIGAAVEALQRGAEVVQSVQGMEGPGSPNLSPQYAETLQLVSMCIAGFRGADPESTWSPVWRKACLTLLKRDDLSGANEKKVRVAYLRSMCTFLVSVGMDDGLKNVLHDEQLSVGDRVAFAIRFLDVGELRKYLDGCVSYCQESGNLEGLVVTGLDTHGLKVMQAYVDKYADVQTAALVCSRAAFTGDWERSVSLQWLDAYRALLNTWQMWQSRAMFDVDVSEYLSKLKEKSGRIMNYQSRRMMHPSIPAQLDARCNKCSKSLTALRGRQEGAAPQRLAKANPKPVLSCCPHCLNALPRCSICLLSLGCLNPYMEAKKERSKNLPIAEWFTWCMRCKHGGHSGHLVGWFANHDVCPVSGCDCRCQFDAMQKLHRRINTLSLEEDKEVETEDGSEA